MHQIRIDPYAFEGRVKSSELCRPVGSRIEVLQRAAAALAEMPAQRLAAPRPGDEPFDSAAFLPSAPADAEPSADAITGHRKGQKDRLAVVVGDAVSTRPQPLDLELDQIAHRLHWILVPKTTIDKFIILPKL
jgi:hypothetical protein